MCVKNVSSFCRHVFLDKTKKKGSSRPPIYIFSVLLDLKTRVTHTLFRVFVCTVKETTILSRRARARAREQRHQSHLFPPSTKIEHKDFPVKFFWTPVLSHLSHVSLYPIYISKKRRTFCNRIVLYPHHAKSSLGVRQSRPRRRDDSTWRRPVVVPSRRRRRRPLVLSSRLRRRDPDGTTNVAKSLSRDVIKKVASSTSFSRRRRRRRSGMMMRASLRRRPTHRRAALAAARGKRGRKAAQTTKPLPTRMRIKYFRSFANALEITWIRNASSGCRLLCFTWPKGISWRN